MSCYKDLDITASMVISHYRKLRKITQFELATKLGMAQGTISKIENGALVPSVSQWLEVCYILDVPRYMRLLQ